MREKLSKLLSVKSIITILLTIIFCYLSITGKIGEQQFMGIFTVIIAFYFGTQSEKRNKDNTL